jgi:hypothetical protein
VRADADLFLSPAVYFDKHAVVLLFGVRKKSAFAGDAILIRSGKLITPTDAQYATQPGKTEKQFVIFTPWRNHSQGFCVCKILSTTVKMEKKLF